jgi:hypothetical protein
LHGWLKQALIHILAHLPELAPLPDSAAQVAAWERWWGYPLNSQFSADLPPLRMPLIMDNLAGHKTPEFVRWLFKHGIVPLSTPLGGSCLNRTEPIQPIRKRRALHGQ